MSEAAVLDAVAARPRALAMQDAAALQRLMHPLCRWTSYAGLVLDRDDYIERNTTTVRFAAQRLDNPVVRIVDETAVVTGTVVDVVDGDEFQLLVTLTWVRTDGRWQLLTGHASPRLT